MQTRAFWQLKQIDASRRNVLAHLARAHGEPGSAEFLKQFLVDQVHLPQIRRVAEFQDAGEVLDRRAGMRVALDALSRQQCDPRLVGFAERMLRTTADRLHHRGHSTPPLARHATAAARRWCPESDLNQRPTAYEAVQGAFLRVSARCENSRKLLSFWCGERV